MILALPEIIGVIAIVLIVGLALFFVIRAKKNGQKCIGCPSSKTCVEHKHHDNQCCCGCFKNDIRR